LFEDVLVVRYQALQAIARLLGRPESVIVLIYNFSKTRPTPLAGEEQIE